MAKKTIKVKLGFRKGEYGKTARLEFPHPWFILKILEVTPTKEQKKYKFHFFNNILVAKNYSEDLKKFLQKGARKLNLEFKFIPEK